MKEINAYLNFDGNCRDAMSFYARCFGAKLEVMPFSEMPGDVPKGTENRVMHSALHNGSAVILMASDTVPGEFKQGNNCWLNVNCESLGEIERLFAALGEGGEIRMPLHDAFWGSRFGMLTDRYGVNWMFNCELEARKK
jgi:PhnB protein